MKLPVHEEGLTEDDMMLKPTALVFCRLPWLMTKDFSGNIRHYLDEVRAGVLRSLESLHLSLFLTKQVAIHSVSLPLSTFKEEEKCILNNSSPVLPLSARLPRRHP